MRCEMWDLRFDDTNLNLRLSKKEKVEEKEDLNFKFVKDRHFVTEKHLLKGVTGNVW